MKCCLDSISSESALFAKIKKNNIKEQKYIQGQKYIKIKKFWHVTP